MTILIKDTKILFFTFVSLPELEIIVLRSFLSPDSYLQLAADTKYSNDVHSF